MQLRAQSTSRPLPQLAAQQAAQQDGPTTDWCAPVGDVTDGIDVGHARPAVVIHHNSAVLVQLDAQRLERAALKAINAAPSITGCASSIAPGRPARRCGCSHRHAHAML
jgi:hypothetical protein